MVLVTAACSNYIGFIGFFWVTAAAGLVTSASLLLNFDYFLISNGAVQFEGGPVAKLGSTGAALSLYVDSIGYSFGLLTSLIGAGVYFYAFSYMRFEKNILNFLIFLQIFKLSMMLLV